MQALQAFDAGLVEATAAPWHFWFGLLEIYVEENEHARVPSNFKTSGGYALGSWVSTQRSARDKLSHERRTRLEALASWVWDVVQAQWEDGSAHLQDFVEQNGHTRVPSTFKTTDGFRLGLWVNNRRSNRDQQKILFAHYSLRI